MLCYFGQSVVYFQHCVISETVRRPLRNSEPLPQHPPTIELRHRSRSPHQPTPKRSPSEPAHQPCSGIGDPLQALSQLPDSNHHLPEEMYPLSVSPAAPNGRCSTPREATCPGSPVGQEAGPLCVIQHMPSAIMNPLLLSPSKGGRATAAISTMDFRHGRGGAASHLVPENGREGKILSHQQQLALAQQQQQLLQEEILYRSHIIMPGSPPEEQQMPMGRIAGTTPCVWCACFFFLS